MPRRNRFVLDERWLLGWWLLILATMAIAVPIETGESLDSLMAKRLDENNTFVVIVEPRTLRLRGALEQLPARGKTVYMTDALTARQIPFSSPVNHKMWLRSGDGLSVMVYVADDVAERIKRGTKAGAEVEITALHLWNSRHGPGLLVTEADVATSWREKAERWFGGRT